jgi:hypothetical protein
MPSVYSGVGRLIKELLFNFSLKPSKSSRIMTVPAKKIIEKNSPKNIKLIFVLIYIVGM